MEGWDSGPFLIAAAPGAGKTRPALHVARELLRAGAISRLAIVCPTTPLTRQWAAAAAGLGLQLAPDVARPKPPQGFDGVAVTYARLAGSGARWGAQCPPDTLVIADEAHHLGEDLAWGEGFKAAFGRARRWLLLSGTPFRSDASPIPGVRYDAAGMAVPDVSYAYADAVRDAVCRPVTFIPYDGTLRWRSGDDEVEASFADVLSTRETARRYRTAISVGLPDGLPRILAEADRRLMELRAGEHRDAGGLVVAADGAHARAIARILRDVTGRAPLVVLHTETAASRKLEAFTKSKAPWIVAVNMVSEGVDIPRLRVGVYATAAKTPLVFRQIVGRFVRVIAGRGVQMSWIYLPGDPVLRGHAEEIERELVRVSRPPSGDDGFDDPPDRVATERSEEPAFVPLSADVAPQLALFGSPAAPIVTASAARGDDESVQPAHERRALLREKRHRLVGELRRRDRRTPAQINAWLNRACGITRVDDASIAQLERACALLLDELTGSARR